MTDPTRKFVFKCHTMLFVSKRHAAPCCMLPCTLHHALFAATNCRVTMRTNKWSLWRSMLEIMIASLA
jgi:hypothetical protein